MGGTGDTQGSTAMALLGLARRAGDRPAALRATVRHWEDRAAASRAWRAAVAPDQPSPPAAALTPGRAAGTTVVRLWQDPATGRGGEEPDGGVAHDGVVLFAHLLRPARALTDLRLVPDGNGTIAGRPARLAVATPLPARPGPAGPRRAPSLDALGFGADRYLLALDAEHGVLLRLEAWHAGTCFARTEITRIAYGAVRPRDHDSVAARVLRLVDPPGRSGLQ
ncbi:MAG: hypothetical protein QOH43_4909 [Solirubrobacteraceae bacterium]|jgi:hypothetical protein|nr:hypothetical protein [Solirubrobacteraceae bacterium]